jgi:hypothetical protein
MKNKKQLFKVFFTSIFVILAFVGCNNTSDVDGVYERYLIGSWGLKYDQDIEFNSGEYKSTDKMSNTEGTFKIIDEEIIEVEYENVSGGFTKYKLKVIRDENNKVIKMAGEVDDLTGGWIYKKK